MDPFLTRPVGHSTVSSSTTIAYGVEPEVDGELVSSPWPPDPRTSLSAHHHPAQTGSLHPFSFQQSSFASWGSSSFPSVTRGQPQPPYSPPWTNTLSGYDLSQSSRVPSEAFSHAVSSPSYSNAATINGQSTLPNEREKTRSIFPSTTLSVPTARQATPPNLHPEHVASWFDVRENAVIMNGPRMFVPQTIYEPRSASDKERYVALATLKPPIIFVVQGSPEWGVPIQSLLSKQPVRLVGGDEPAFASRRTSIGIRLQWPGYPPYHRQVQTRDYTLERRVISKEKLAAVVAKCVKLFMDGANEKTMPVGSSDAQWRVGPHHIGVDDVILVSLHHVSKGSWQPQLLRNTVSATQEHVAGYSQC